MGAAGATLCGQCRSNQLCDRHGDADGGLVRVFDPDAPLDPPGLLIVGDGPAEPSRSRNGVVIEREYDLFDPVQHKTYVRDVAEEDHVFHVRSRCGCSDSLMSDRDSSVLSEASSQLPTMSDKSGGKGEVSSRSVEVTTRWGVLAGKVLYYRVLALTTLGNKFISRKRAERSIEARLWGRIRGRAEYVVTQARKLARLVAEEPVDRLDHEWTETGLLQYLFTTEYLDSLMILAKAATKLLSMQPMVVEASAPCRVFGDIHGQLRDMLVLFNAFGCPGGKDAPSCVFNGDFVDRGRHQLEVLGILLALKIAHPDRVWLVRGNHEDRPMNEKYGFKHTCINQLGQEFGLKAFDLFEEAFDHLPVACLVSERIMCVHGGVGDGRWDLNDLRAVQRPMTDKVLHQATHRWVRNILWSDPIEDDVTDEDGNSGLFGVHESPRSWCGGHVMFGWNVTKTFCARNGLGLVVRSHQSKQDGLGFDIMHDEMLIRVFSARDYEGGGNDGAVLLITERFDKEGLSELRVRPQIVRSAAKARVFAADVARVKKRQATAKAVSIAAAAKAARAALECQNLQQ